MLPLDTLRRVRPGMSAIFDITRMLDHQDLVADASKGTRREMKDDGQVHITAKPRVAYNIQIGCSKEEGLCFAIQSPYFNPI